MAAPTQLDILIQIAARLQGMEDALKNVTAVRQEAEGLANAFRIGFGVDIVHRFIDALAEIPAKIKEAAEEGIHFNALMETSRLGVAGVLKQFDSGSYKDFNAALADSDKVLGLLLEKANKLGLSFESMLEQYRTTAGALFAGGVKDLQKQVDLTVLLQQAMAAIGVPEYLRQRDIIDLLEGRAARTIAGRALGISDEDIKRASDAGQLYDFLTQKFQALAQAGAAIGETFSAAEQRAKNLAQQLAGIATRDIFAELKDSLTGLNDLLASDTAAEHVRAIGGEVAGLIFGIKQTASAWSDFIAETQRSIGVNPDETTARLRQAAGVQAAYEQAQVYRTAQFLETEQKRIGLLREEISSADTITQKKKAQQDLETEISTISQRVVNSEGDMQSAASTILGILEKMRSEFEANAGAAKKLADEIRSAADAAKVLSTLDKSASDLRKAIFTSGGNEKAAFDEETLQLQQSRRTELQKLNATDVQVSAELLAIDKARTLQWNDQVQAKQKSVQLVRDEGQVDVLRAQGRTQEADALSRQLAINRELERLGTDQYTATEAERAEAAKIVDAQIAIKSAKQANRDLQQDITALTREEALAQQEIRNKLSLIDQNQFLTTDQKNAAQAQLIPQAIAQFQSEIAKLRGAQAGTPLDSSQWIELEQKIQAAGFQIDELKLKFQTLSFGGQFRAEITQWANSIGTAAHAAATALTTTLNTAIGATSSAITALIFHTGNWKQAFAQAAQSIVQNLIQIALQFVISRLVMSAINAIAGKAEASAANTQAQSAAAAWSSAATSASIATYGVADIVGTAAYIAALAAGKAAAVASAGGGFKGGGYTGDVAPDAVTGVVHGREFVQPARVVEKYGTEIFEAFRKEEVDLTVARTLVNRDTETERVKRSAAEAGLILAAYIHELEKDRSGGAGFAAGGFTGQIATNAIAGVVHGGEFVQPAHAVARYGTEIFEAFRQHKVDTTDVQKLLGKFEVSAPTARLGAFESGGYVADPGPLVTPAGSSEVHEHYLFFNFHDAAKAWAKSSSGKKELKEVQQSNRV